MKRVFLCAFAGFLMITLVAASVSCAGMTVAVSVDSVGKLGNKGSYYPAISADGRFVAFATSASNLVPDDTNGMLDIFVHDLQTGATEVISKNSVGKLGNGPSNLPSISADGRFVAFVSRASNLVPGDTNEVPDVFVHDRQTGTTELVSKDSAGNVGNGRIHDPVISADGRFVAFASNAGNLILGDISGTWDIFVHDRQTGVTEIVSVDNAGRFGNGLSYEPAISADGRFVVFRSEADNLVPDDTNGVIDVFIHDRQTGTTEIVSKDSAGKLGNYGSSEPAISADGRFVAFRSAADNLVPADTNRKSDIFVHDRQTGATEIVSVDNAGRFGNGVSYEPAISADGRFVAFASEADNLVPDDTNGVEDAFVHDRQTGATEIVNVGSFGIQGNRGGCSVTAISADGRFVAFESEADNLVLGDTNRNSDVFVHNRD